MPSRGYFHIISQFVTATGLATALDSSRNFDYITACLPIGSVLSWDKQLALYLIIKLRPIFRETNKTCRDLLDQNSI